MHSPSHVPQGSPPLVEEESSHSLTDKPNVGLCVGLIVGFIVGLIEGGIDGLNVGDCDGFELGTRVGNRGRSNRTSIVGLEEGTGVDGSEVGEAEGENVGT